MNDIVFTNDALNVQAAVDKVSSETCGAVSIFLDYECYGQMAHKELEKICERLREKWPDILHILIHHRLGSVPVKESSVLIAISSPHRVDAMAATQYCIDNLKAKVPIWKKEVYDDGTNEWMENNECSWKSTS
uniref:molybdopterin synthase catalytic subunit isoform X2 n=1 Tax=Ciona intestinalis TaxID=7719 RepID=UPI000180C2B1|nr:molybdopterin synthase catalytic subunit isoform X2 [Ciona intestinalis]|eukprot:XP_002131137.1 molybdopterin synthase catalytic subunit isoform X2 [Ciona intestinalis]